MSSQGITSELIERHGLTAEEYERILQILGREPNLTELGIFSVMWSEHCSYKSSRVHLRKLPTQGPAVIQGPGENAGVVDIGAGLAAVFKIESHNHPSYIEPYQGAATGVGGIIRDIFTMGARPIALMDSLHFGPLEHSRNQLTMEGVVEGIAGYGNCIGIPTVGGEVHFEERYGSNPLVNVFCLGIAPADRIFYGKASGPGNPVIYVGARTGKDGIHGATMASEEFSEDSESKRPTVQVGDPFMEKLLLEACLEAMKSGAVVGIQDMGAAGLTCSTCEMGGRAGLGLEVDLDRIPQREGAMTPYEVMLSESQERMLLVAEKGREEEVLKIFRKWDLEAEIIGEVRDHDRLVIRRNGEVVAELPNRALTDEAPLYDRPSRRPDYLSELPDWKAVDPKEPDDYNGVLRRLLSSAHLCSRRWVYEQYDHMVRTNTVVLPGSDAAVLRLKKGEGGLALTVDANSRFSRLDPRRGAVLVVAEACRNLVCTGARPLAATNCLNFASPENPEVMWQFIETVEGIAEACTFFGIPITGGNVSFYNETRGRGIFPTPVLGMVGRVIDLDKVRDALLKEPGDLLYLLGENREDLGGSIYLEVMGYPLCGPCPSIDLAAEKRLQEVLLRLFDRELLQSVHDLSQGGLAIALAESAMAAGRGVAVDLSSPLRTDVLLFGETPSRVLVSLRPQCEKDFLETTQELPVTPIGRVTADGFRIRVNGRDSIDESLSALARVWESSLPEVFST